MFSAFLVKELLTNVYTIDTERESETLPKYQNKISYYLLQFYQSTFNKLTI